MYGSVFDDSCSICGYPSGSEDHEECLMDRDLAAEIMQEEREEQMRGK